MKEWSTIKIDSTNVERTYTIIGKSNNKKKVLKKQCTKNNISISYVNIIT